MNRNNVVSTLKVVGTVLFFIVMAYFLDMFYHSRYEKKVNYRGNVFNTKDSIRAKEGELLVIRRLAGDSIVVQSATLEDVKLFLEEEQCKETK